MPYANKKVRIRFHKSYYRINKKKWSQYRINQRQVLVRIVLKAKNRPCKDCHKTYPSYVMDFDHKRNKKFDICRAYHSRLIGPTKLLNEIKKCDIVCSNCHRIRTHKRKTSPQQRG